MRDTLPSEEVAKKKRRWQLAQSTVDFKDYYGLLGLAELELNANQDDIKKAYRRVAILCHPDKAKPEDRDDAEARFKGTSVLNLSNQYVGYHSTSFDRVFALF